MSTIFYVSLVLFELPWVVCIKRFGANKILVIAIVSWSIITLAFGFIHNYQQSLALRFLLGMFEACLFPGLTFIISTIYSRQAQGKRVAVLYGTNAASGAFGGLIAYGIQLMGERRGIAAWRWLFIIEGTISLVVGLTCWFTLPKNAETAWFLTEEEKALMVARKARDAIYKGKDKFEWSYVKMAITDPAVYISGVALFCASVPLYGFGTFLPTLLRGMGYSSLQANYLTIPVYIWGIICLYAWIYTSDRIGKRAIIGVCAPIPVVIGYAIAVGTANIGAGFFGMFLCAGGIYAYNCTLFTWLANNLTPDYKRSAGISLLSSIAACSGFVSSQIYPPKQGPRYIQGNAISCGMEALAAVGIMVLFLLFRRRNAQKEKMIAEGSETNGQLGDRALNFKYII